ncbi:MAG: 5'-nucleotidase C-terminal domain-containing protein [Deltaproteobacteria bacterium]
MRVASGLLAALVLAGCPRWNGSTTNEAPVGATTVSLSVAKDQSRAEETPFGDLVADGYLASAPSGTEVGLLNAGSIRCEAPTFPANADNGGCVGQALPPGPISAQALQDVLPFEDQDHLVVVKLTAPELKSTLERSVSSLPGAYNGWFLQVSGLSFSADCSKPAQLVDSTETQILADGQRVLSISVGGNAIDLTDQTTEYSVVTNSFTALGKDGHVKMAAACAAQAGCPPFSPSSTDLDSVEAYLNAHSPVDPKVSGRIVLQNCGQ